MKKELLTEIKRFNEIINYNPKVGIINEVFGERDVTGWPAVGQMTGGSFEGYYIRVNPDYDKIQAELLAKGYHEGYKSDYWSITKEPDSTVGNPPSLTSWEKEHYMEIYPEYKNTKFYDFFYGKRKDQEVLDATHKDFMSRLYTIGNEVVLHHNSSYRITDGYIKKGKPNRWSNNSDVGIYFWASKNSGGDPSGIGQYTYYCKVPLSDLYDQETNEERTMLVKSMHNHKYVGQKWNDGAIVVTTYYQTPIWFILKNSTGKCYDANWEEIECPLP